MRAARLILDPPISSCATWEPPFSFVLFAVQAIGEWRAL